MSLRIATRASNLALAQSGLVGEMLGGAELVQVAGDGPPGDKARFVRGVEQAVLEGRAEIGVHSAKDLPAEATPGLSISGVPAREDPRDAWVGPGGSLDEVPEGATVGTVSLRRRAQLLALRPDLRFAELRGNVDTRLRKLDRGEVDAVVLAVAGLNRLGLESRVSFAFDPGRVVPAAGQGILAVQTVPVGEAAEAVATISDERAVRELVAERAAVAALEADCSSPIGIHCRHLDEDRLAIDGFVGLPDGSEWVRDRLEGRAEEPAALGRELAARMEAAGAAEVLERASSLAP